MGFEMKTEKDVLSKDQCKVKSPNPNSVNSPHIKKKKKKKNKSKKTKKTSPPRKRSDSPADEITAVRRLFDTCKEVFSDGGPGVIPSQDKIQQLRDILGIVIRFDSNLVDFLWVSIKFIFLIM